MFVDELSRNAGPESLALYENCDNYDFSLIDDSCEWYGGARNWNYLSGHGVVDKEDGSGPCSKVIT